MCAPGGGFVELLPSLPASVANTLEARGIREPTPIQAATLARAHLGESLVLHAETGSGKSLAFLLPALTRLGIAGAEVRPPQEDLTGKVLVVAPTRELAVQLANEAAMVIPAPGAVQIVAVGATPDPTALLGASVVACTAPELLALLEIEGDSAGAIDAMFSQVRVLVLDELDTLLPVTSTFSRAGAKRKQSEHKKGVAPAVPAELLIRSVVEASSAPDLQLIAASATVSRPTRFKLARVLRRDPLARWYESAPEIVRPLEVVSQDLSAVPRAVGIPAGVSHFYMPLIGSIKLRRATAAVSKRKKGAKGGPAQRVTLKQKRALKAARAKAAKFVPKEGEAHPLFTSLRMAVDAVKPKSALVFLCRSSGLTVRRAAKELSEMGLPAVPLHEAIGLEHAAPTSLVGLSGVEEEEGMGSGRVRGGGAGGGGGGDTAGLSERKLRRARMREGPRQQDEDEGGGAADPSGALQLRHRAVSAAFSATLDRGGEAGGSSSSLADGARDGERTPLLITFEDMARGLHFDAVDAVFILGMPDSPATYLHLAGRTGRQPVLEGTVVTICPGQSHEQLLGWGTRLGGINFEKLAVAGGGGAAAGGEAAEEEGEGAAVVVEDKEDVETEVGA